MTICDFCGKEMCSSSLRRHVMTVHTGEVVKSCHICDKGFANMSNYHYHMAHHSEDRNFLCTECPKAYKTKADLVQHERGHDKLKGRKRERTIKEKQTVPKKSSSPQKRTLCGLCNKTFLYLKKHMREVHDIRPHSCPHCDKTFATSSGLSRHVIIVHNKLKNFACTAFDKAYEEKAQPVEKMVRKFHCDMCHRAYPQKSVLLKHIKRFHLKIKIGKPRISTKMSKNKNLNGTDLQKTIDSYSIDSDNGATENAFLEESQSDDEDNLPLKMTVEQDVPQIISKPARAIDLIPTEFIATSEVKPYDYWSAVVKEEVKETVEDHIDLNSDSDDQDFNSATSLSGINNNSNPASPVPERAVLKSIAKRTSAKPIVTKPLVEEPLVEEPIVEESIVEEPLVEEPIVEEPIVEEPIVEEPIVKNVFGAKAFIAKILIEKALVAKPKTVEPKIEEKTKNVVELIAGQSSSVTFIIEEKKSYSVLDVENTYQHTVVKSVNENNQVQSIFVCEAPNCGKTFSLIMERNRHFHGNHPELSTQIERDKRTCSICKKFFTNISHMRAHFISKHSEFVFHCPTPKCKQFCLTKELLDLHLKEKNRTKKEFFCEAPNCGRVYKRINLRNDHFHGTHPELTTQIERDKRTCSICKKFFTKVKHLRAHFESVHDNIIMVCPHCPCEFKFKRSLNAHIKRYHRKACPNCSKIFESQFKLEEHWESEHQELSYPSKLNCDLCKKFFTSELVLSRHKRTVHTPNSDANKGNYSCTICKEVYGSYWKKDTHMKRVHKNGELLKRKCLFCDSEFDLFNDFKAHIETHKDVFICITCGAYFPDCDALSTHAYMTHLRGVREKKYTCDLCEYRSATKNQMKFHMRKYHLMAGLSFIVCDICGKLYYNKSAFNYHVRTHDRENIFGCDLCDKKFFVNELLVIHRRSHTGERPFKCEICKKGFSSNSRLKVHRTIHRPERKTFDCKMCNIKFDSHLPREAHIAEIHPELRTLFCKFCHRLFRYDHTLEKHMKFKHPNADPSNVPCPPDRLLAPQFNHNNSTIF